MKRGRNADLSLGSGFARPAEQYLEHKKTEEGREKEEEEKSELN